MMHKYSCSIIGARGYTGLELAQALLKHEAVNLQACFATSDFDLSKYFTNPKAKDVKCLTMDKLEENLTDFVFLATPADVSMDLAPIILAKGKKVIDLSGAFRLKKNDYMKWYKHEGPDSALLKDAVYGLVPWSHGSANLVANPGCYATAILMAILPLLKSNLIKEDTLVIDAKSGSTGAGKKASENLIFTEVDGECLPYKIGSHQHFPEIVEAVEMFTGKTIDPHFSTSLLPTRRGIIAGIYCKVNEGVTEKMIASAFNKAYENYALVNHSTIKENPELLSLKKVVGTAFTNITYTLDGNKLYVYSVIDNLAKGAATQAVENFNRMIDIKPESIIQSMEATI